MAYSQRLSTGTSSWAPAGEKTRARGASGATREARSSARGGRLLHARPGPGSEMRGHDDDIAPAHTPPAHTESSGLPRPHRLPVRDRPTVETCPARDSPSARGGYAVSPGDTPATPARAPQVMRGRASAPEPEPSRTSSSRPFFPLGTPSRVSLLLTVLCGPLPSGRTPHRTSLFKQSHPPLSERAAASVQSAAQRLSGARH